MVGALAEEIAKLGNVATLLQRVEKKVQIAFKAAGEVNLQLPGLAAVRSLQQASSILCMSIRNVGHLKARSPVLRRASHPFPKILCIRPHCRISSYRPPISFRLSQCPLPSSRHPAHHTTSSNH